MRLHVQTRSLTFSPKQIPEAQRELGMKLKKSVTIRDTSQTQCILKCLYRLRICQDLDTLSLSGISLKGALRRKKLNIGEMCRLRLKRNCISLSTFPDISLCKIKLKVATNDSPRTQQYRTIWIWDRKRELLGKPNSSLGPSWSWTHELMNRTRRPSSVRRATHYKHFKTRRQPTDG